MFCKTITKHGPKMEKILTTCKTKTQEIFHHLKHITLAKKRIFKVGKEKTGSKRLQYKTTIKGRS